VVTAGSVPGWPFLVARGRETGYQLLLAPDFMLSGREAGQLLGEVQGEVPAQGPAQISTVTGPVTGPYSVVQRTARATRRDVGEPDRPEAPLLDRAGRPILLGYGFVCRGARVVAADEGDLAAARDAALAAYRRFHAAEYDFVPEPSTSYPLRSTLAPVQPAPAWPARPTAAPARPPAAPARPPAAHPSAAPAWTSQVLPTTTTPAPRPRISRPVVALLVAAVLFVLGVGVYLASSGGPAKPADVAVPNVVGMTQDRAELALAQVKLESKVVEWRVDKRPAGTVIETNPKAAELVPVGGEVGLVLSIGPAPSAQRSVPLRSGRAGP
jgi:hypothetical protein